jgi:hypothetical protein
MIHSQSKSHLENIKTTYPQSRRLFVCFVCFVPFDENLEIKFLSNFPKILGATSLMVYGTFPKHGKEGVSWFMVFEKETTQVVVWV